MANTKQRLTLKNGTIWPNPLSEEIHDSTWRLIHHPEAATPEDMMRVASVVEAYCMLMTHPAWTLKEVGKIVSMIRKTMKGD